LGVCVEIHTETGSDAEAILDFFVRRGVRAGQIVLCHMDKARDLGLHRSLAEAGACLEYDTFYRPKYAPNSTVWPLIQEMARNGLDHSVALATDMADASMWKHIAGGPGLIGFVQEIRPRLEEMRLGTSAITNLMGGNIVRRLSGMA
jgi:phosphotriesterase-related protein